MSYKTKVQSIKKKNSEQLYFNVPMFLAHAMEFTSSEEVEWVVSEDGTLILTRPNALKKTIVKNSSEEDLNYAYFKHLH